MSKDYTKGGRGKTAPYKTTHCRIPEEIKELVDQLSILYRKSYDEKDTPAIKALIDSVQNAINDVNSNSISEDIQEDFNFVLDEDEAIKLVKSLWEDPPQLINRTKLEKLLSAIYKMELKIW